MSTALNAAIEEMRDELAESIERLKQDPKMTEVLRLHEALNVMEGLVSSSPTSLAAAFALEPSTMVQPGDFFGLNPLKAAKKFLKAKGKPASLDEIVTAIRSGGAIVKSVDKLRVSLGRSNQDVAKVGPDHYGLLEFYPHVQRGRKGKAETDESLEDAEDDDQENGNGQDSDDEAPALSLEEVEAENE